MAVLSNEHDLTTHASYIPEIWPEMAIEFRDKNLVMANLVLRRDVDVANYGDTVHYPVTSAGTAVDYVAGTKLSDNLQVDTDSTVDLSINKFKIHPFHISWNVSDQVKMDTFALAMRQAGEAVARAVDSAVHTECANLTTHTQNDPSTDQVDDLAIGDIVGAFTDLNGSDVPATDRAWVFHPTAYGELLQLTGNYFTSYDFTGGRPMDNGKIGMMLGAPVYQSTNIGTASEGSPAETAYQNLYIHKDAVALAMQRNIEVESSYDMEFQGTLGNARCGFGVKTLRADHGVRIFTVND